MDDFETQLKMDFIVEVQDVLNVTEQTFLSLEKKRDNPEVIDEIFRLAHNIKGTAAAVGFESLSEVTHHVENLLLKIKNKEISITDEVVAFLLSFNDRIKEYIVVLSKNMDAQVDPMPFKNEIELLFKNQEKFGHKEKINVEEILKEEPIYLNEIDRLELLVDKKIAMIGADFHVQAFEEMPSASDPRFASFDDGEMIEIKASSKENDFEMRMEKERNQADITKISLSEKEEQALNILDSMVLDDHSDEKLVEPSVNSENSTIENNVGYSVAPVKDDRPKSEENNQRNSSQPAIEETIRIGLEKVKKLNNYVGELVILQSMLEQKSIEKNFDKDSVKAIAQLSKISKSVQELAMSLRMVPVKTLFQKLSRVVRDTSRILKKEIKHTLIGEDTEIDKTVLEALGDPLLHIVRNAVDHGIEENEKRAKSGKNLQGSIEIKAYHEGSHFVIKISDDGGGIDPAILRKKAFEKGIIKDMNISDQEAIRLIFAPGFSTKESVTSISGRGVGMDVVNTNITKLSGKVEVHSELGKGSVFKVVLPLTLAIIDGLVVRVANEKYIVPLGQVNELVHIKEKDIEDVSGYGNCLNLREEVLPIYHLSQRLNILSEIESQKLGNTVAIIFNRGLTKVAVQVDEVLLHQQIVIKQLGVEYEGIKGLMGSSILGDGLPALILDLQVLFEDERRGH